MNRLRRAVVGSAAGALAASGLAMVSIATAPAAQAAEIEIDNASFTWGLSGYAQKGIFGPWTFKDLTGDVTQLVGSVSGGTQTTYAVDPLPATSMPVSTPQKTPNAVRFTGGEGTADPETGAMELAWTGSYTVNAYPAQFNAPNEVYSDPELTVAADGSGELTMEFALGAGVDVNGNPTPAVDLGRLPVMTYEAGALAETGFDSVRLTPAYQGVEVTLPEGGGTQTRDCTTTNGATGWWGAWPQELVTALPASVRPHFYSTGCGGLQDNKPPLPADVDLNLAPEVVVSDTTLTDEGSHQVTITGTGFDPSLAVGTRPPLAGKPGGTYVTFGKFAETWRPSQGAPSSARKIGVQRWAVLAADMATIGGPAAGAVELRPDGSFEATLTVDKAAMDAVATDPSLVNYGIYTYAGSGASVASYETYTPITFVAEEPGQATISTDAPSYAGTFGTAVPVEVTVSGADEGPAGAVTLLHGTTELDSAELVDGTAVVEVPAGTGAGEHDLTVAYGGDAEYLAAERTVPLSIARATTTATVRVTRAPTTKRAGAAKVIVRAGAAGPGTGKVSAVLRTAAGDVVRTVRPRLVDGAVTVALPRRAPGRYRVVVTYAGTADLTGDTATASFRIAKPRR